MILDGQGRPVLDQRTQTPVQWSTDFYIYQVPVGSIAAAATFNTTLTIQADSYFEWVEATLYGNKNGQAESISNDFLTPVTVQITDSGSGRQLFSAPVPANSFAGNGKQPFILPVSRIFLPNSTLSLTFVSFGAATFDNVSLSLIGRKLFNLG